MKIVELIRLSTGDEYGTFGVLRIGKQCFCVTLERADRQNMIGESSIPTGQYICNPYSSPKYPDVYQVMNVPGRTKILFHKGNTLADTAGCIMLGQYFNGGGIRNSGIAFNKFREAIRNNQFHLTITENY